MKRNPHSWFNRYSRCVVVHVDHDGESVPQCLRTSHGFCQRTRIIAIRSSTTRMVPRANCSSSPRPAGRVRVLTSAPSCWDSSPRVFRKERPPRKWASTSTLDAFSYAFGASDSGASSCKPGSPSGFNRGASRRHRSALRRHAKQSPAISKTDMASIRFMNRMTRPLGRSQATGEIWKLSYYLQLCVKNVDVIGNASI